VLTVESVLVVDYSS